MKVICLEEDAFYTLVEEVVARIKEKEKLAAEDKWISGEEAMRLLRITSKTTLMSLKNRGKIRFSQPQKKILLFDRDSIYEYLEKHAKNTF